MSLGNIKASLYHRVSQFVVILYFLVYLRISEAFKTAEVESFIGVSVVSAGQKLPTCLVGHLRSTSVRTGQNLAIDTVLTRLKTPEYFIITMAPGYTQPLTEISTRRFLVIKRGRRES
jgi:hypothetical protein